MKKNNIANSSSKKLLCLLSLLTEANAMNILASSEVLSAEHSLAGYSLTYPWWQYMTQSLFLYGVTVRQSKNCSVPHDYCCTVIVIPLTNLPLVQWGTSYCRVGIPRIGHLLSCTKGGELILHIDPSRKKKVASWDIFRQKTILPKKLTCVD